MVVAQVVEAVIIAQSLLVAGAVERVRLERLVQHPLLLVVTLLYRMERLEILWVAAEAVDYKVFQPQAKENSVGVQVVEVVLPLVVLVAVLSLVRQEAVAVQE
jgi:hypothetical protein